MSGHKTGARIYRSGTQSNWNALWTLEQLRSVCFRASSAKLKNRYANVGLSFLFFGRGGGRRIGGLEDWGRGRANCQSCIKENVGCHSCHCHTFPPHFSRLPNSNVTQGSKGTHGQLCHSSCPLSVRCFIAKIHNKDEKWKRRLYGRREQDQTTAAWVAGQDIYFFFFRPSEKGKSNRSNTAVRQRVSCREMSLVLADNYCQVGVAQHPSPTTVLPKTKPDTKLETHRMNGHWVAG